MLRYRIIRSFAAVWCAVCLSYMGVRTAISALAAGNVTQDVSAVATTGEPAPPTSGQGNERPTVIEEPEETVTEEGATATGQPPSPEAPVTQGSPVIPNTVLEPSNDPEQVPTPVETIGTPQEAVPDETPSGEEVGWQDIPAEPVQDKTATEDSAPSLEEYLSGYTCGSCGRNCSLLSPGCRRGSRLAQLKAQEYFELL